jgi:hypothetical protein
MSRAVAMADMVRTQTASNLASTQAMQSNAIDLATFAFKSTTSESYPKYNLVDQVIDGFADSSGIDTGNSTNEILINNGYYVGISSGGNYFGDGSDGAFTSDGSDSQTVLNKRGSYDGDMLVRNYTSLNIQSGHTFIPDQPCRGMLIYVQGNATINGTLSMTARGAHANPYSPGASDKNSVSATGIRLSLVEPGAGSTLAAAEFSGCGTAAVNAVSHQPGTSSNGYLYVIQRMGSKGGSMINNIGNTKVGQTKGSGYSGGGGCGGREFVPGIGSQGTCFSGGTGGGGANSSNGSATNESAANGEEYGGSGGDTFLPGPYGSGGAGNPGGTGNGSSGANGSNGTGGLLILVIGGNLSGSGAIHANGSAGGAGSSQGWPGGGGSGGGNIVIVYAGSNSYSGSKTVTAGAGGAPPNSSGYAGGAGGLYGPSIINGLPTFADLTLQSNATTALTAPTIANITMLYSDGGSSATSVNTDVKAYVSRDGTNFTTAVTLVTKGTSGTNTILSANDIDLTGITSGTAMKWKITTHNQNANKQTRIHSMSLGWG